MTTHIQVTEYTGGPHRALERGNNSMTWILIKAQKLVHEGKLAGIVGEAGAIALTTAVNWEDAT